MSDDALSCATETRRAAVRAARLNGLDYLEVGDDLVTLVLRFIGPAPDWLGPENARIDGGRRVRDIRVVDVRLCPGGDPELDDCVLVTLDRVGDASTYSLRLVKPGAGGRPGQASLDREDGFDRRYTSLPFTFTAGCPTELDCGDDPPCPPEQFDERASSYLAKDYASFRQLLFDRMALLLPEWRERHVPDIGVALLEALAYAGDEQSYYQDAVATEAYLDTARRRISVRRHVRLIDYRMHDGCNARAFVCVEVDDPLELDAADFAFVTGYNDALGGQARGWALTAEQLRDIPPDSYAVFEPLLPGALRLDPDHNEIHLWTWGDQECCLQVGATRATLRDRWLDDDDEGEIPADGPKQAGDVQQRPTGAGAARQRALDLRPGDVLILEEVTGPRTGNPADANPTHRQAVRLTSVTPDVDDVLEQPVLEVEWAAEDALIFPLCIAAVGGEDCRLIEPVSVARGNVILVDHGHGVEPETFDLPCPLPIDPDCEGLCRPGTPLETPTPLDLVLSRGPVTRRGPFPPANLISQKQAELVAAIPAEARDWLEKRWRRARTGERPSDDDLRELRRLFSREALERAGLVERDRRGGRGPAPDPAAALAWLLGAFNDDLAGKLRRIEQLAGRARAGYLLGAVEQQEIAAAWGAEYAAGLDADDPRYFGPAAAALGQEPRAALAVIDLRAAAGDRWEIVDDLLASDGDDRHVVAELDNEGYTHLRAGDSDLGAAPEACTSLTAVYRVGNGTAGNVGAESIARIVFHDIRPPGIRRVRNPLPARGGVDPEPLAEVKLFAPDAFRSRRLRAITAADYADVAAETRGVQRAAADLRWTGGWYEARVAVDPLGTTEPEGRLLEDVREALFRYRRIGHDLVVEAAHYVPLDIELLVCIQPGFLAAHVRRALLEAFSAGMRPGGGRGFFHPDALTFGDDVYLSALVTIAQNLPGVESVQVRRLKRQFEPDVDELDLGVLALDPLEVPQLENDWRYPERGRISFTLRGGR